MENSLKDKEDWNSENVLMGINEAYQQSQNGLFNTAIDFTLSGTTCVTLFIKGNNVSPI